MLRQSLHSEPFWLYYWLFFLFALHSRLYTKWMNWDSEYIQYQEVKYRYRIFSLSLGVGEGIKGGFKSGILFTISTHDFSKTGYLRQLKSLEKMHNKNLFTRCDLSCVSSCFLTLLRASEFDFYVNFSFLANFTKKAEFE